MRRFVLGLLIGVVMGWVVAWWRAERAGRPGWSDFEQEPMRIALPDVPREEVKEEAEVPVARPVVPESAEPDREAVDQALDRARAVAEGGESLLAYCARCRAKQPIQNPEPAETRDGRPAMRGTCPVCGANMFRFVSL